MTTITLPRAVVEQALEALETLVPTKGPSIYNSARDALRAALAQQAEPTPPDAAAGLVDDLCLLQLGWGVSDAEGVLHRAAMGRVIARATEVRRLRKIEQLKAQLAQMEGNT